MDFTKDSIDLEAEEKVECSKEAEYSDNVSILSAEASTAATSPEPSQQRLELVLSPWEKWMVKKAQEDRAKREKEHQLKLKEKEDARAQKKIQQEKRKKSKKAFEQWTADKAKKQVGVLEREKSATSERVSQIEKKKQLTEEKAKASYEEWCAKKHRERIEREKHMLEEKEKQAQIEHKKRERGAKAYRDWMRVNYDRQVETNWYTRMEEKRTF